MKILGVGLSKTGTSSLHRALGILGLKSLHYDERRLRDVVSGPVAEPDFRRYDDVDAVLDIPAAYYFEELMAAYPGCKCILTVRREDDWWRSIGHHFNVRRPVDSRAQDPFKWDLRRRVYGSATAREFVYRKKYRAHNERVMSQVPAFRLLVMDVAAGDGWEKLCPFLDVAVPGVGFPHQNRRDEGTDEYRAETIADMTVAASGAETVVLIDDGVLGIDALADRRVIPFLERGGVYWGRPGDDEEAIGAIERLCDRGASRLIVAWPSFWWLDHYTGFNQHLRRSYPCIVQNDRIIAFDLGGRCPTAAARPASAGAAVGLSVHPKTPSPYPLPRGGRGVSERTLLGEGA